MSHNVPFDIEQLHDVEDFQVPPAELLHQWAEEAADTWQGLDDLAQYVDYHIDRVRVCKALATAAKEKADKANKIAKGYLGNVEYNRGLIESALSIAYSKGFIQKKSLKGSSYSCSISETQGSVEIDSTLDLWRQSLADEINQITQQLVEQVMTGAPIEIGDYQTARLANLSISYMENCDPASEADTKIFKSSFSLSWDKVYIKNNMATMLTDKLATMFKLVKGVSLTLRL